MRQIFIIVSAVLFAGCTAMEPAPDLEAYLGILGESGFPGAILVARDGDIVAERAYGLADVEGGRAMTTDTVFDIGSLSKQFTAAAVLVLAEEGRLRLDDPIGAHLGDIPEDKAGITILHLLTHSSGLVEYAYEGDFVVISRDAAVDMALESDLDFTPGKRWQYSDTGYGLLAAIVEKASGQPFMDFLHQRLFKPSGMESTGFYNAELWASKPVAHGYWMNDDMGPVTERPGPGWGILGFGGVLSTTGDLFRWHTALRDGTVLSRDSVNELFTPRIKESFFGRTYATYGWVRLHHRAYGDVIFHSGATDSNNSMFLYVEESDTLVIALSNRIDARKVIGPLLNETMYASEAAISTAQAVVSRDYGRYPSFVKRMRRGGRS